MWTTPRIGLLVGPQSVHTYDLKRGSSLGSALNLSQALEAFRGSRAQLEVVLSDAHCRYLVMPRPEGVRNRAELSAAMQSRFRAMFGDVEGWQVRHEAQPFAEHDFVAGADGGLLTELEDLAQAARVRVVSIRPHWVAWARHFRRRTRRGDHWVVGTDGTWVSLGYVSNGQCRQARALRVEAGAPNLEDLLARERAFVDDVNPAAPVWMGGAPTAPVSLSTGILLTAVGPAALWGLPA
ncbi:MAG: hypothetical protein JF606_11230 [Burkholderiales bacterium]|nr:hypothetical protein [Burkholderiales bacterium]